MAFAVPNFTRLKITRLRYVGVYYTEFEASWAVNKESKKNKVTVFPFKPDVAFGVPGG
jgi:hypothetical protein